MALVLTLVSTVALAEARLGMNLSGIADWNTELIPSVFESPKPAATKQKK